MEGDVIKFPDRPDPDENLTPRERQRESFEKSKRRILRLSPQQPDKDKE